MTVDWEAARSVNQADVYKAGVKAATLHRTADGVVFDYVADYRDSGGPPVASTLPLAKGPMLTPSGALPPFFAGLLPEGRRLSALRRAVKTSADDELSLLVAVGNDAVGDVQIVPGGQAPSRPAARVVATNWADVDFNTLIDEETGLDLAALPGVQEKVSAATIAVPTAGAYILKLDPPEYPHLVANEAFFLRAARSSGIPTTDAEVVADRRGNHGLLVRRFDRQMTEPGEVRALGQEDACQALARYPADKYAVSAIDACAALVAMTRAKPVAARDLLRHVAFAYLTGNGDQHAKNLSVLQSPDGEWRISPAYDVPSTYPYGDTTVALAIAGRSREDITRTVMLDFAGALRVTERAAVRVLDGLCETVDVWIEDLDGLPFDERRRHKLRRLVLDRRAKLSVR